jgi:hypothetical protein
MPIVHLYTDWAEHHCHLFDLPTPAEQKDGFLEDQTDI